MTEREPVIDVRHLSKAFAGRPAVVDVSLKVMRGEIFGFLGPNGSGKTTTIRMLCGLLTPDSGEGHCLGYDILTQAQKIKAQVGYMTQRFTYYEDLSVYENLDFIARLYQLDDRDNRVKQAIAELGLSDRQTQLAGELSGGWKQRLALAACLLHKPQLLLLDEPTAGVDPKARREFWDQIHELRDHGITTLVSTHYMDEAERCTRLAYISAGRILVDGSIADVIEKAGLSMWHVSGAEVSRLIPELRALPAVLQVVPFGQELHISGQDPVALKNALEPFMQRSDLHWREAKPALEDAFIYYVSKMEHSK